MITRREFLRFSAIFGIPEIDVPKYLTKMIAAPEDAPPFEVDFKVWLIRPEDLLDLEIGFMNVLRTGTTLQKRKERISSFMIIRLPQMHISEQTYLEEESLATTVAGSFLSGASYLIFKINSFTNLSLKPVELLNWQSSDLELVLLDKNSYAKCTVDYSKTSPFRGLTLVESAPVTSFEIPYGVTITPISNFSAKKSKASFHWDNKLKKPNNYIPSTDEASTVNKYLNAIKNGSQIDNAAIQDKPKEIPSEIWYNDLSYLDTNSGLLLKVIDLDPAENAPDESSYHLIPEKADKQLYKDQFIQAPAEPQIIRVTSSFFRITALGLTANLDYVSPNKSNKLQKLYQEIVFARDKYVEAHHLGFIYPLGIRAVLVIIGRRKIKDGVGFIERRTYIAPLEKTVSYRNTTEQDENDAVNSVLKRVIDGTNAVDTNYVKSCKRAFPFQQIDVLTNDFIEIVNYDDPVPAANDHGNIISKIEGKVTVFWPVKKQKEQNSDLNPNVQFDFAGTDWDGKKTNFSACFIFVSGEAVAAVNDACQEKQTQFLKISQLQTGVINEEFIFTIQDLLQDKKELSDLLLKIKNGANKDLAEIQNKSSALSIKLYKRYAELKILLPAEKAKDLAIIEAIINPKSADVNGLLNDFKTAINTWDQTIQFKGQHLLYTTTFYCSLEASRQDIHAINTNLTTKLSSIESELNALKGNEANEAKLAWYTATKDFYRLDEDLNRSYHAAENDLRRQILINSEKISYYKSKVQTEVDEAGQAAEQKINELETHYIELAATPISRLAELRRKTNQVIGQIPTTVDNHLKQITDFGQQYALSYPQLLAAQISLPVVKELMNEAKETADRVNGLYDKNKLAVIAYADAYRVAGIEDWDKTQTAVKRNAEKILFDVQKKLPDPKEAAEGMAKLAASYQKDIKAPWEHLQQGVQDYEINTIGYGKSIVNNIFAGAEAKVGGLIDPGVAIAQISAIKGKAFTLNNDINLYTGEINSYLKQGDNFARDTVADVKTFENNIKDYAIGKKDQLTDLLGDIKLFGMELKKVLNPDAITPGSLPNTEIKIKKKGVIPVGTEATYSWTSPPNKKLFNSGSGLIDFINGDGSNNVNSTIRLSMTNINSWDGEATSQVNSSITLEHFGISAAQVIKVYFKSIAYRKGIEKNKASNSDTWKTKTDSSLKLTIDRVEFSGFLELIKQLEEALGLGNNFLIDANTDGITLSYGIRIPTISTGAFTLSNFSLYAGLVLSFQGKPPSLRFSFSERANPFTLAVGIYGGRGFFALNVSKDGIDLMEGLMEFGGYFSLDIAGIAKGQAYLMAGIYFRRRTGEDLYVESYLTCGGSLSIIGIIQISIVFYLGMSYQNKSLRGRASVDVSISILFFSASYNLTFEKQISGGQGVSTGIFNKKPDQFDYIAVAGHAHGPNNNQQLAYEDQVDSNRPMCCYLFIEDVESEWDMSTQDQKEKKVIPIYDPSLLFEEDMDLNEFTRYITQFAK